MRFISEKKLAERLQAMLVDFNWDKANVRLEIGPIYYGPGIWQSQGNPVDNIVETIFNPIPKKDVAAIRLANGR